MDENVERRSIRRQSLISMTTIVLPFCVSLGNLECICPYFKELDQNVEYEEKEFDDDD